MKQDDLSAAIMDFFYCGEINVSEDILIFQNQGFHVIIITVVLLPSPLTVDTQISFGPGKVK